MDSDQASPANTAALTCIVGIDIGGTIADCATVDRTLVDVEPRRG